MQALLNDLKYAAALLLKGEKNGHKTTSITQKTMFGKTVER